MLNACHHSDLAGEAFELTNNQECPTCRGLNIIQQIASGLSYLHSIGLAHLDLSSRNILLNSRGQAKITDVAIGKLVESMHAEFTAPVIESAAWCAPERRGLGGKCGLPSDIWSLGTILWEVVTPPAAPSFFHTPPFVLLYHSAVIYTIAGVLAYPVICFANSDTPHDSLTKAEIIQCCFQEILSGLQDVFQVCKMEPPSRNAQLSPLKVPDEASQEVADMIGQCRAADPADRPTIGAFCNWLELQQLMN